MKVGETRAVEVKLQVGRRSLLELIGLNYHRN
jgi:hypothetical protein